LSDKPEPPRPAYNDDAARVHPPEPPAGAAAQRTSGKPLLAEGSRFGVYLVGPCIGEGGMARIYRAEHEGLQRQVALKVLLDGHGRDADGHERFLREARIAAAIKHPNVVNIFDVGVHQGRPYLVMELLEGMDLEAFVESQGPLDEATLMDVIIPIVAGLAAVHDAGIVHRDLKPGNIYLARGRNDELEPKLLDFGISKSSGPNQMKVTSSKGLLMGTPFYMSPEASQGHEMTPLSDQYALGVVLYECATGTNPFALATTFGEVVRQVTTGAYAPVSTKNPRLSKRMAAIIERAMHLDPARRFPDMRAMGRELLMLAGQRTRITWGLSFSELADTKGIARVPGAPLSYPPRRESDAPGGRKRRTWPLVGFAFGAAAIALLFFWPQPQPRVDTRSVQSLAPPRMEAPARPAQDLRSPEPPIAQSPPAEVAKLEPPLDSVRPEVDDERDEAAPAVKANERSRTERPRTAQQDSAKRTRDVEPTVSRPQRRAAIARRTMTPRTEGPDWVVSTTTPLASPERDGPDRGTNNAPILP
jgi:serine/threonine protein kinase